MTGRYVPKLVNVLSSKKWRNVVHEERQSDNIANGNPWTETGIMRKRDNRQYYIGVFPNTDVCNCCGETKRVLEIDNSDGEYAPAYLCAQCVTDLIDEEHLK